MSDLMRFDKISTSTKPKSIRLERSLEQMVTILIHESGARDFTDFIRGLLILRASDANLDLAGIAIPGWVSGDVLDAKANRVRTSGDLEPKQLRSLRR